MTDENKQSYDFICFTDLAYEFDPTEQKEIEKKIRRRLKYYKLGTYNQERVDYLRLLKNDLHSEISQTRKSKYFHKSESIYADFSDFDVEQMTSAYLKKYPKIVNGDLMALINFAIYLFYLR